MKVYLISLSAGLLVGIIYSVINVRSPTPPLVRTLLAKEPASQSWHHQVKPHVFGHLPRGAEPLAQEPSDKERV